MSEFTKILIIRFSSIGDIVLTTPIIRCLKLQLHGASEIHFLTKKKFAPLLDGNPHLEKIHELDDNLSLILDKLELEDFDYILDLHKNLRSFLVRRRLKKLTFDYKKLNIQKWMLVNFRLDFLPDVHLVDRYFDAIASLGVTNDGNGLEFYIPETEKVDLNAWKLTPDAYIAFSIGGAHAGKKLSTTRIIELCWKIEQFLGGEKGCIVLLGGTQDADVGGQVEAASAFVKNLCGKLSVQGSASVIQQSKLVISFDSGMMHIAAAFKKKIISIWGATVPKFGMYPYAADPKSVIIQAEHLKFRPTSKLGNKNSSRERRTMEEIDLDSVVKAVGKMWF